MDGKGKGPDEPGGSRRNGTDVTPMSASNSSSRLESGVQILTNSGDDVQALGDMQVEVPSQSSDSTYMVEFDANGEPTCTCMDHQIRGTTCKHIYAAADELQMFDLRGDNQ